MLIVMRDYDSRKETTYGEPHLSSTAAMPDLLPNSFHRRGIDTGICHLL